MSRNDEGSLYVLMRNNNRHIQRQQSEGMSQGPCSELCVKEERRKWSGQDGMMDAAICHHFTVMRDVKVLNTWTMMCCSSVGLSSSVSILSGFGWLCGCPVRTHARRHIPFSAKRQTRDLDEIRGRVMSFCLAQCVVSLKEHLWLLDLDNRVPILVQSGKTGYHPASPQCCTSKETRVFYLIWYGTLDYW
jgi:hypothetical protein